MTESALRHGRILVVEDSRTEALALQMALSNAGYEVVVALHGGDGLHRVQNSVFDLVLCDVQMPVMDGYEFCAAVRADAQTKRLPLLLLTSLRDPHDFMAGLSCGATGYVTKPYEAANLLARVASTLERARQAAAKVKQSPRSSQFLGRTYALPDDPETMTTYLLSTFEEFTLTRQREHDLRLAEQRRRFELDGARRAERFLQSTLDALSDAIAVIGADGRVVAVNEVWSRFASSTLRSPFGVGGNYLEYVDKTGFDGLASATELGQGLRDVIAGKQQRFGLSVATGSGVTARHFTISARRFAADGTVWAVVGHQETTEQHRAEDALRHHAELQRLVATLAARFVDIAADDVEPLILEAFSTVASFCQADCAVLQDWNSAGPAPVFHRWKRTAPQAPMHYVEITDLSSIPWLIAASRAQGAVCVNRSGLPPEAAADAQAMVEMGLQSVLLVSFSRHGRGDGLLMLGAASADAWTQDDAEMLRMLANVFDNAIARQLSQRVIQQAEMQLRESQKMEAIGRLAGGIAHDFNNLLMVVHVCADTMLGLVGNNAQMREEVDEIMKASRRATELVKQLLAFSRRQVVVPTVEDVDCIVYEIEQMMRRLLNSNIQFALELRASPGTTLVDRHQLEQVLVNLVVNARDAMPSGGALHLSTEVCALDEPLKLEFGAVPPGEYVIIAVRDEGHGMDASVRARVFEPFFTTKEVGRGTGLGLSTSYGIVRQAGGHIGIESEPNQGTTIRVYLPTCEAGGEATTYQAPGPQTSQSQGTETLLVVDDEEAVRRRIVRALQGRGYQVLSAADGQEALEICQAYAAPIDLLLTDAKMPRMDGPTLIRHARDLRPAMKLVMVSGYASGPTELGAGPDVTLLAKPFEIEELLTIVRSAMDRGS